MSHSHPKLFSAFRFCSSSFSFLGELSLHELEKSVSNATLQKSYVLLLFLVFPLCVLNFFSGGGAPLNISSSSSSFLMLLHFPFFFLSFSSVLSPFLSFSSPFFLFLLLLLCVVHCPPHEGGESTSNAPLGKSGKIRRRRQSWLMQCCTPRHCSLPVDTQQTKQWQCGNMEQCGNTSKRQQMRLLSPQQLISKHHLTTLCQKKV